LPRLDAGSPRLREMDSKWIAPNPRFMRQFRKLYFPRWYEGRGEKCVLQSPSRATEGGGRFSRTKNIGKIRGILGLRCLESTAPRIWLAEGEKPEKILLPGTLTGALPRARGPCSRIRLRFSVYRNLCSVFSPKVLDRRFEVALGCCAAKKLSEQALSSVGRRAPIRWAPAASPYDKPAMNE
jgi:hypothetical protein